MRFVHTLTYDNARVDNLLHVLSLDPTLYMQMRINHPVVNSVIQQISLPPYEGRQLLLHADNVAKPALDYNTSHIGAFEFNWENLVLKENIINPRTDEFAPLLETRSIGSS